MRKFKITMASGGGVVYDFMRGLKSEQEAIDVAESFDWHFIDENGFDWSLEVVEE